MKFLWVSNHTPFLTNFGGGQRSHLIYHTLRQIAEVDVLLLTPPIDPKKSISDIYGGEDGQIELVTPSKRGEIPPWHLIRNASPGLIDKIAHQFGSRAADYMPNPNVISAVSRLSTERGYDLYVARHLRYAGQAGLLSERRAIVDVDDNEVELYRWRALDPTTGFLRKIILQQRARTLGKLYPSLTKDGPKLWVSKEEDRSQPGFEKAAVLPNIPFAISTENPPKPFPSSDSKTVLFVGMLSYVYNKQGLDWFLRNVWPEVHARRKDATFLIVGSHLKEQDRLAWSSVAGVKVEGFVPDLAEVYRSSAFSVVPVWSGSGTNIKVVESFMYGRTCLLSEPAYRGYDSVFSRDEMVSVAQNKSEMVEKCIRLLSDQSLCRKMAESGAIAFARRYSFPRFQEIILNTVNCALTA